MNIIPWSDARNGLVFHNIIPKVHRTVWYNLKKLFAFCAKNWLVPLKQELNMYYVEYYKKYLDVY